MSVSQTTFEQFREAIQTLGDSLQPETLSDAERVRRAKRVFLDRLDINMAFELESCVHCGMCAEACHFYVQTEEAKYTPTLKYDLLRWVYRREVGPQRWLYRLISRDIRVQDLRDWEELVFDSCTECGRCALMCPMGINIPKLVHITREALGAAGIVPKELQALAEEQSTRESIFGVGRQQLIGAVEKLREQGTAVPLDQEKADIVVLTTVVDIMLFTDALAATARIMNHLGVSWTMVTSGFEAANFGLLSGHEDLQRMATKRIIDAAIACGASTVIVPECGHAYPALRWEGANELGRALPFEVLAISEFLGREIKSGRLKVKPIGPSKKVTYHDPCKVARHGGAIEEPREALKALAVDLRETASNREMNWCCGGGAGVFVINRAAGLRQKAFEKKKGQVDATGADTVVTTCGSCRLNLMAGASHVNWDKSIESLVEMVGANLA
ncbi:MAG: (Fe-S)-binding protein [Gammaproteobacteria bacterium]